MTTMLELPASVADLKQWLNELPADALIEASVYTSFRKATGQTKVQRLLVREVTSKSA